MAEPAEPAEPAAELVRVDGPTGGVATLTLQRPEKKNALSVALRDAVSDALDRLAADEDVRAVVLTGAGDCFSAGFDLDEFGVEDSDFQERLWRSADRFHHTVLRFPLPTVAAVNGPALAGGFDLAVMCDVRLASTTARFAHPEQRWSDVLYSPLADAVGGGVARDLCMSGRSVDADEALALRLVAAVVEPGELAAAAAAYAADVAAGPRDALARTKAKALACSGIDVELRTLEL